MINHKCCIWKSKKKSFIFHFVHPNSIVPLSFRFFFFLLTLWLKTVWMFESKNVKTTTPKKWMWKWTNNVCCCWIHKYWNCTFTHDQKSSFKTLLNSIHSHIFLYFYSFTFIFLILLLLFYVIFAGFLVQRQITPNGYHNNRDISSPSHIDSDYKYGRFDTSAMFIAHALKQTEIQKAYNKRREKPIDFYLVFIIYSFYFILLNPNILVHCTQMRAFHFMHINLMKSGSNHYRLFSHLLSFFKKKKTILPDLQIWLNECNIK